MGIFDLFKPNKIAIKKNVKRLIKVLNHKDYGWLDAPEALGRIGDPRAVEPLIQALNDAHYRVRRDAARALGNIGSERAVEPLDLCFRRHNTHFCYEDDNVAESAKDALERIKGKKRIKKKSLAKPDVEKLKGKKDIERLIGDLKDDDPLVRLKAAETLGEIGDPRAVEPLIQTMKGKYGIVEVVTSGGDKGLVGSILQKMNDEDEEIKKVAKKALEKIKAKK